MNKKNIAKELCLDILQSIENEPDLLNSIITCDETWVFTYDPETKRQSCSGCQHHLQDQKNMHESFEVKGRVDGFL